LATPEFFFTVWQRRKKRFIAFGNARKLFLLFGNAGKNIVYSVWQRREKHCL
jgi:hypothetical protein